MSRTNKIAAAAIVIIELVSVGAATSASAQSAVQARRQLAQQQRIIRQQQRRIRQLEARQQTVGHAASVPATSSAEAGLLAIGTLGGIITCPPGYTMNLVNGCLPNLVGR